MKKIWDWVLKKIKNYKKQKQLKKKIEELRKRDPFIYKH